jgi:hypothetical protein
MDVVLMLLPMSTTLPILLYHQCNRRLPAVEPIQPACQSRLGVGGERPLAVYACRHASVQGQWTRVLQ